MNEQEIREALVEWENLSANKENKVMYEARLKYLRDQLSNLMGERRVGREEGLNEGIKEGKREIADNMLKKGFSLSQVAELTGLTEEEIRKLN